MLAQRCLPLLDLTADWDSRARTCTYLIQSQAPYQFGHIPKIRRYYHNASCRIVQGIRLDRKKTKELD